MSDHHDVDNVTASHNTAQFKDINIRKSSTLKTEERVCVLEETCLSCCDCCCDVDHRSLAAGHKRRYTDAKLST